VEVATLIEYSGETKECGGEFGALDSRGCHQRAGLSIIVVVHSDRLHVVTAGESNVVGFEQYHRTERHGRGAQTRASASGG